MSADGLDPRPSSAKREPRRLLVAAIAVAAAVGFAIFVLPQIKGLNGTFDRLRHGEPTWLVAGVAVQTLSLAAYVALFHAVFSQEQRIGWRASVQITLASDAAGKLFAAAGAGSIALTVWAVRAAGLTSRTVARLMLTLEVLLYAIYLGALLVGGAGLRLGIFSGPAPMAVTTVPAALSAVAIALGIGAPRLAMRWSAKPPRFAKRLVPAAQSVGDGVRGAYTLVRKRPASAAFAASYWALDIATLWASFHAFGSPPTLAVLVVGYFVGTLGNALPLPGGLGGVEGGLIGAYLAFGVHGSLAVLAVLAYRAISYWLPTLPSAVAYVRLRGTVSDWRAEA